MDSFGASPVVCTRVPVEVERLIARFDEAELDEVIGWRQQACDYGGLGLTASEFLREIARVLHACAPPPDTRWAHLIGHAVTAAEPGPQPVVVIGDVRIRFLSGFHCVARGHRSRVVTDLVGERILYAAQNSYGLTLATDLIQLYNGTDSEPPPFRVE
ncbi:hypothetical protein [Mariniluteicoccus flavus]